MKTYQPLHIQRVINAPRQAIWDAWTQPKQFKQWFMPSPYGVADCSFDLRVGGAIAINTQAPDGSIMPLAGEYRVVDAPNKLVMTNAPLDADGNKLFEVLHTIELHEHDGQTTLDITAEVIMATEQADPFLAGMEPGLNQALDQMTQIVEAT